MPQRKACQPAYLAYPSAVPFRAAAGRPRGLAKRVIACLDVRANDNGDLVVTKGDQYDVREASSEEGGSSGEVSVQGGITLQNTIV